LAFTCAQVAKVFTHWCAARPPITPRDRGVNYLRSPQTLSSRLALTSRAPTTHDPFRRHTTGKLDYGRLVGSGGMPSSHTALVVGLTTSVGLKESLDSSIFAMCLVFSLVVMYDATGVRLHAGRQAEVLNQMIMELPATHPASESRPLRNSLGHTPPEVGVGAIVGLVVGYIHYSLWITQWGP
jgi:acid phosphatase family membrane protein YuiD